MKAPEPVERLQIMASAHAYFNDKAHSKTGDGSTVHTWAAAAGDVKMMYQVSSKLLQPRNPVLTFPGNASLRIIIFPAAEAFAWIKFLQQIAMNPAVATASARFNTKLNVTSETIQVTESLLRAKDAWIYDAVSGSSGYGYIAVSRCELSGIFRLIVKANMFPRFD